MIPATRWAVCREAVRNMSPMRSLASSPGRKDPSKQRLMN